MSPVAVSPVPEAFFTGEGKGAAKHVSLLSCRMCFYFWGISLVVGRWLEPAAGAAAKGIVVLVLVFVLVLVLDVFVVFLLVLVLVLSYR